MERRPREIHARRGFTLVELVAVIVVLGTLAAVAAPRYFDHSDRARRSAAKAARAAIVEAVNHQRLDVAVNGSPPTWPATIDPVLQDVGGARLLNPYVDPAQAVYNTDGANDPTKYHPTNKTIEAAMGISVGAIWYNNLTGSVRFRVPEQPTIPETLALYNDINNSAVSTLAQTSP